MLFGFDLLSPMFIISQILVFFSLILDNLSFKEKTKLQITYFLIPSAAFIGIHYFLLGKTAVALIYVVAVTRLLTSTFIQDNNNRKDMTHTFLIIQSTIFIVFFDEAITLLVYVAHCFFIMGSFGKTDKELRISFMVGTVLLIIYNAIIFSPIAFVMESVYLISNIIFFKKYFSKVKKNNK